MILVKSPRRLPSLSLREANAMKDDYGPNPFYLGSTGKTPRPMESVEQALGDKMKDFVLQTGGGFASVDLRKIHQGPALIPEGVITIGKRPHVLQKGPPQLLAKILHRLNKRRTLITRFFADQTVNRWKLSLVYLLFRGWANVTTNRPKSVNGMLAFINRARGQGVRFWFNRWHHTHNTRCRNNIRMRELKLLNEHRLRLLEIETTSLEAEQVNGLVASDLKKNQETVKNQGIDLTRLQNLSDALSNELKTAKERLSKLEHVLGNPALFVPERTAASLIEWDRTSKIINPKMVDKIEKILTGLLKRPWQNVHNSIRLEEAAKIYRKEQLVALQKRKEEEFKKLNDPFKFNNMKYEHHVNPLHPQAKNAMLFFWENEVSNMDIHHLFHRLKETFKSKISRTLYGKKIKSCKTLFNAMDVDNNGTISRIELWESMQRLDLGLSVLQIRTVLHAVDADNNGTIEYAEFKTAFKKSKTKWDKWIGNKKKQMMKKFIPNKKERKQRMERNKVNDITTENIAMDSGTAATGNTPAAPPTAT